MPELGPTSMLDPLVEGWAKEAGSVGQDRSGFLALMIDGFYDEITAFAKGYAARIIEQGLITEQRRNKKDKNS